MASSSTKTSLSRAISENEKRKLEALIKRFHIPQKQRTIFIEVVRSGQLSVDPQGESSYQGGMREDFNEKSFDFCRHLVAFRDGIDVSKVTEEYLDAKLKAAEKQVLKEFKEHEKKHGIKLKKHNVKPK